jgi:hypothetical protein
MMGDRFPMGISAQNGLWDEPEAFFGGGHHSTSDDHLSNVNVFKALSFMDHTHSRNQPKACKTVNLAQSTQD